MKLRMHNAPWIVMLVGALFALLALLAVLQYRWLGEVSQGERERMQANLKIAASHLLLATRPTRMLPSCRIRGATRKLSRRLFVLSALRL